jgi:hypothetical protein
MSIDRIYRGIFGVTESWDNLFFNQRLKLRVGAIHEAAVLFGGSLRIKKTDKTLPLPLILGTFHTSIQQRRIFNTCISYQLTAIIIRWH